MDNQPEPAVNRAQTPPATASVPKYRLKVALRVGFPQDRESPVALAVPDTALEELVKLEKMVIPHFGIPPRIHLAGCTYAG